jgi:hypothetical protein
MSQQIQQQLQESQLIQQQTQDLLQRQTQALDQRMAQQDQRADERVVYRALEQAEPALCRLLSGNQN